MSVSIVIKFNPGDGNIAKRAERVLSDLRGANRACAEGASVLFQNHFRGLSQSNRNKFGVRGGFWGRMFSGIVAGSDENQGFILIPREAAARRYGATITPKKGKFLAIPARAEAYGNSPRQFNDLRFVPTQRGGMLVKKEAPKGSSRSKQIAGKQSRGQAFYFLVPKVVIRPNPAIFPSDEAIATTAQKAAVGWFQRMMRRGGRG